jgi:hypothetical protein
MQELANRDIRPALHDGLVKVRSSGTDAVEGNFGAVRTIVMEISTTESTLTDRLRQIALAIETTDDEMYDNAPLANSNLVTPINNMLDVLSWEMCDEELVGFDVKEELDTIFEQEYHLFHRVGRWMGESLISIHL